MKFTSIDIENFRGIRKLKMDGFKEVNFIIGKNNTSKTSVLEAIFLNIGISNSRLPLNINLFRGLAHTNDDDFRLVFYRLNFAAHPKFISKFDYKDHTRQLEISPYYPNSTKEISKPLETSTSTNIETTDTFRNPNGLKLEFSIKEYQTKLKKYSTSVFSTPGGLEGEIPGGYTETIGGIFITHSLSQSKLDERLERRIVNKEIDQIISNLTLIDNSIKHIELGTKGVIYADIGIERLIPINLIGDGTRKLLSILLAIADTKNGVVIIDEIENGFYHTAQKILVKAIFQMAKQFNVQVFATTHSYEILRHLQEVLEEDNMTQYQPEVKVFALRKLKDDKLKSYAYDFEKLKHAIEQEIEIR